MNYDEVTSYLLEIPKFSKKTSLENLKKILAQLGNPQEKVKSVHVAGTNGKGSVCAFLDTILRKSGKTVGLFTSPHLTCIRERMRVNGEMISEEEFVDCFFRVKSTIEAMEGEGVVHASFFEFLFLMAVLFFEKRQVEYVVFETGLGGRLDATNVLKKPQVSIITALSLDHTEILGDTMEKIAAEKGGIIKKGVPVICYDSCDEATEVVKRIAKENASECILLKKEEIKLNEIYSKQVDFSLKNRYYSCENVRVNFPASYQAVNASLALLAFMVLKREDNTLQSVVFPERFLYFARWEGRMEQVRENIFLDGAHNISGILAFMQSVKHVPCRGRRLLLFSVVAEKDYEHMIPLLLKDNMWEEIFVAHINNPRAVPEQKIAEIFRRHGEVFVSEYSDVQKAFDRALEVKKKEDILFCAGSLYLIGELKEYLEVNND